MIDLREVPQLQLPEGLEWKKDLSLSECKNYIAYLEAHDWYEFKTVLVPNLHLEDVAPIRDDDEETGSDQSETGRRAVLRRKVANRRGAMRGIAMELLTGSSLRHWDKPAGVIANVKLRDDEPSIVAQGGKADVVAHYPGILDLPGFRIHGEVSAKEYMDLTYFDGQLESGWKHADAAIKESPDLVVYCLLVNRGKFFADKYLHNRYLDFIRQKGLGVDSNIRMVPMYTGDFAIISDSILLDLGPEKMYFEPEALSASLDAVYYQLLQYDLPAERTWMRDLFMHVLKENVFDPGVPPAPG